MRVIWPLYLFIFILFTFEFNWQIYSLNNINWKKHRWCAGDSNPGRQNGRRRRIHWAMAAPPWTILYLYFVRITVLIFIILNSKQLASTCPVNNIKCLKWVGFEPRISGVRSNHSILESLSSCVVQAYFLRRWSQFLSSSPAAAGVPFGNLEIALKKTALNMEHTKR